MAKSLGRSIDSVENRLRLHQKKQWERKDRATFKETLPPQPPKVSHPIYREVEQAITRIESLDDYPGPTIKIAALFDSHYPETINLNPFISFLKDFKPDIFIFGGDNWDLACVSHHNKDKFASWGLNAIMDELNKQANGFALQIQSIMKASNAKKYVYIIGNHEDWLQDFCFQFPQVIKPSIKSLIGEVGKKIEFLPVGSFYKVGKLTFCHGDQMKGGQNPAKYAVDAAKSSIVFGHYHTFKIWPSFSMVDAEDKNIGVQVPCYTTSAPSYGGGKPNQINQGFFTACIEKESGKFSQHVQLVSPRGNFMSQMGKVY